MRKILFEKWMEQSGVVGEKILGGKIDIKNSSPKTHWKNSINRWSNWKLENWWRKSVAEKIRPRMGVK